MNDHTKRSADQGPKTPSITAISQLQQLLAQDPREIKDASDRCIAVIVKMVEHAGNATAYVDYGTRFHQESAKVRKYARMLLTECGITLDDRARALIEEAFGRWK